MQQSLVLLIHGQIHGPQTCLPTFRSMVLAMSPKLFSKVLHISRTLTKIALYSPQILEIFSELS